MPRILVSAIFAGFVMGGVTLALADDMSSQPPPTKKAMMKDCIAKQQASDSSMSMKDVKSLCAEKVKSAMDPTGTDKVASGKPDKP